MYALQAEPNGIAKILNNYQFVFDKRLSYLRKSVWGIAKITSETVEVTYVRLLGKSEKQETETKLDLNVISFLSRRNNWDINKDPFCDFLSYGKTSQWNIWNPDQRQHVVGSGYQFVSLSTPAFKTLKRAHS